MAKWCCSEQLKVTDECLQLYGGTTEIMKNHIDRELFA